MPATYSVSTAFKAVDRVSGAFIKMGNASKRFQTRSGKAFKSASKNAMGFKSVMGGIIGAGVLTRGFSLLTRGIKSFVTEASKIEDATAAFTPLMGGTKKAMELVKKLNSEAASTPFQFEQIAGVAKQLLPVMAGDIGRVTDTFRMLGDTAGGNAQKLESITRGFTKAMLKGKVDMESLNMIGEAGVPIFTELATSMGKKVSPEFFKMISAGKVTTKDLTKAFRKMTSEGGLFFNGMAIASQTVSGKFSTLKDNVSLTVGAIGLKLFPVIKKVVDMLIKLAGGVREWVNANQDLINSKINETIEKFKNAIKIIWPILKGIFKTVVVLMPAIKGLVAAFLVWKLAILLVNGSLAIMSAFLIVGKFLQFIKIIFMLVKAKGIWTAAQWALNIALNANPLGLIVLAAIAIIAQIGILVGLVVLLVKNWDKLKAGFLSMIPVFRKIGKMIFELIISPIMLLLQALALIPGIGNFAQAGIDKINGIGDAIAGDQSGSDIAPNEAQEAGKRDIGGNASIVVSAAGGAKVDSVDNNINGVKMSEMGPN